MENLEILYHRIEDSNDSFLITGQAGAGKSSLVRIIKAYSKRNTVLLASTGVAAQLINGTTLHSFFGFQPGITEDMIRKMKISKKKELILSGIDTFVIDEVSMIRADWLDCVEAYLHQFGKNPRKPFGGYQLVLSGDLFQLPPVVQPSEETIFHSFYETPFFFSAHSYPSLCYQVLYLHDNLRQTDKETITLLHQIREGEITKELIRLVNEHVSPMEYREEDFCIVLTATHEKENRVNEERLSLLSSPTRTFSAFVEGNYPVKQYPTQKQLSLAIGAQVMFVTNDTSGRYVNGTLGIVEDILDNAENPIISIRLEGNVMVRLEREVFQYRRIQWDNVSQRISSEVIGRFIQFPVRLAWAITIHKSQGKTFQNIHIDLGRGAFAEGQVYVALSRCRSFEDVTLQVPLQEPDLLVNPKVQEFYRQLIV